VTGVNTRRASFLGVLVALALALHVLEAQIPAPLPWVRRVQLPMGAGSSWR
jgi:uncharacterized membrane protein